MGSRLNKPRAKRPQTYAVWTEPFHPVLKDWEIKSMIEIAIANPQHVYLFLTKRAARARMYLKAEYPNGLPQHIGIGVTVGCKAAIEDVDRLRDTPAGFRFVSAEPLLEHMAGVNLSRIDWLIVGSESKGHGAGRLCDIDWVGLLLMHAWADGLPVFVKQLTIDGKLTHNLADFPEWAQRREPPKGFRLQYL